MMIPEVSGGKALWHCGVQARVGPTGPGTRHRYRPGGEIWKQATRFALLEPGCQGGPTNNSTLRRGGSVDVRHVWHRIASLLLRH